MTSGGSPIRIECGVLVGALTGGTKYFYVFPEGGVFGVCFPPVVQYVFLSLGDGYEV